MRGRRTVFAGIGILIPVRIVVGDFGAFRRNIAFSPFAQIRLVASGNFAVSLIFDSRGDGAATSTPAALAFHWRRFFGLLILFVGLGFFRQNGLPFRNRDLIVIGMNFVECEKAMAIAAIFDECGLKRRFDPGYPGEIDISL